MDQWPPAPLPEYKRINGVVFELPQWLDEGQSIFLPSLNHQKTIAEVRLYYTRRQWQLMWAERIEGGLLGIRVWRVA